MTKIIGLEEIQTGSHLQQEINAGGRFVMYQYVISLLVITFRRNSNIYFIRADESRITKGLVFSLLSLFLGWWGIPWGIIYTPAALFNNFSGGKDVTAEVLVMMSAQVQP